MSFSIIGLDEISFHLDLNVFSMHSKPLYCVSAIQFYVVCTEVNVNMYSGYNKTQSVVYKVALSSYAII